MTRRLKPFVARISRNRYSNDKRAPADPSMVRGVCPAVMTAGSMGRVSTGLALYRHDRLLVEHRKVSGNVQSYLDISGDRVGYSD